MPSPAETDQSAKSIPAFGERIRAIVDARETLNREHEAEIRYHDPEWDFERAPKGDLSDVVRSILAVDHYQSFDLFNPYLQPTMPLIIDAIVLEIAGKYYDPWPKITKDRLAFLLAGRSWSEHGSQFPYEINPDRDVPLTFRERVKAEWHRDWLEQGLDLQRKRAVGLGAEAAELRGRIEEYEEETR